MTAITAEERDLLEGYVEAALIPRGRTDRRKYPIYVGRVAPVAMDVLGPQVEDALRRLAERGVPPAEIAAQLGNPTRIMRAIHTFNEGLIVAGAEKQRRQALVLRLLGIAQELKAGGVLCRDGDNRVLSEVEVEELAGSLQREPATDSTVATFQGLAATLWSVAESLYFACHGVAREQHGAYPLPDGTLMIVRDYRELAPRELWPEAPAPRHSSLRLIAWHSPEARVAWDVFNNLYVDGPPLSRTLSAVAVLAGDGRALPTASLGPIVDELLGLVRAVTATIDGWDETEIARRYLDVLWWQVRPLAMLLEEDWRPPQSVLRRLDSVGVGPHSDRQPTLAEIRVKMDLL